MNNPKMFVIAPLLILCVLPSAALAGKRERAHRRCSLPEIIAELPKETLSSQESSDILFSREEEKLARDVYLSLYEQWDLRIFRNISRAEKTHMKAVLRLIRKYDLTDPAHDAGIGSFSNKKLQDLYIELVKLGSKSEILALTVGALIEDMDIADLQIQIDRTDNADTRTVYQNLMKGSRNHLRAFVGRLEALGVEYAPEYLTPAEYQKIIDSPKEKGGTLDESGNRICGKRGPSH